AEGAPELPAEMPRRHVDAARERLDVQRLRVLAVHPIANTPQAHERVQLLRSHVASITARHSPANNPRGRRGGVEGQPGWAAPPPRQLLCRALGSKPRAGTPWYPDERSRTFTGM